MKKFRYILLIASMATFAIIASLTSSQLAPEPAPMAQSHTEKRDNTADLYPQCDGSMQGDVDCNGIVDTLDFELLRKRFKNGDTSITITDFETTSKVLPTGVPTIVPSATPMPTAVPTSQPAPRSGFSVQGNRVVDASGNTHIFRGVNRPSLEWSATGENISTDDFRRMRDWNANVVRLPLNQKYWRDDTNGYRARISQTISTIESLGMDVILDLHWSDKGDVSAQPAQQRMADANSVEFWKQVAAAYKNDPRVLFELYNEPHDISWDVWLNGGDSGDGFTAAGMQQMYDAIRAAGANNIVIIGGLNWAFDLSGVATHRVRGSNIMYATHPYNYPGKNNAGDWDKGFGYLLATDPVIMTEFGDTTAASTGDRDCDATFVRNLLAYTKGKGISWTGWAWYPGGCGFPPIIKDWAATPNSAGEEIKRAMGEQ